VGPWLHLRIDRRHGGTKSVDLIEMTAQQEKLDCCSQHTLSDKISRYTLKPCDWRIF
jgi:hypothetical protein